MSGKCESMRYGNNDILGLIRSRQSVQDYAQRAVTVYGLLDRKGVL